MERRRTRRRRPTLSRAVRSDPPLILFRRAQRPSSPGPRIEGRVHVPPSTILVEEHEELSGLLRQEGADRFSQHRGASACRAAPGSRRPSPTSLPVRGRVTRVSPHKIVVGRVLDLEMPKAAPLLFSRAGTRGMHERDCADDVALAARVGGIILVVSALGKVAAVLPHVRASPLGVRRLRVDHAAGWSGAARFEVCWPRCSASSTPGRAGCVRDLYACSPGCWCGGIVDQRPRPCKLLRARRPSATWARLPAAKTRVLALALIATGARRWPNSTANLGTGLSGAGSSRCRRCWWCARESESSCSSAPNDDAASLGENRPATLRGRSPPAPLLRRRRNPPPRGRAPPSRISFRALRRTLPERPRPHEVRPEGVIPPLRENATSRFSGEIPRIRRRSRRWAKRRRVPISSKPVSEPEDRVWLPAASASHHPEEWHVEPPSAAASSTKSGSDSSRVHTAARERPEPEVHDRP